MARPFFAPPPPEKERSCALLLEGGGVVGAILYHLQEIGTSASLLVTGALLVVTRSY